MKRIFHLSIILLVGSILFSSCCGPQDAAQKKADIKDAYESLLAEFPEAKVTHEDDKVKIVLPEALLFTLGSADIQPDYVPTIGKMARILNKYPKTSILVTGYTDISGSKELNDELSYKRAESAKAVLLQNGVANKRIYTWGFGSRNPIASNDTEEGRQQNRRVEFVVMYDYQPK